MLMSVILPVAACPDFCAVIGILHRPLGHVHHKRLCLPVPLVFKIVSVHWMPSFLYYHMREGFWDYKITASALFLAFCRSLPEDDRAELINGQGSLHKLLNIQILPVKHRNPRPIQNSGTRQKQKRPRYGAAASEPRNPCPHTSRSERCPAGYSTAWEKSAG